MIHFTKRLLTDCLLLFPSCLYQLQVHKKTTRYLTHCQCSHLTWFGADLFIPPNKLDIKSSFKKLPEIYKHPALLATFCVIIGLYLVGLVWARRKDRRDITKVWAILRLSCLCSTTIFCLAWFFIIICNDFYSRTFLYVHQWSRTQCTLRL